MNTIKEKIINLWRDMDQQQWHKLDSYFLEDAIIMWHNTNELFTVEEFIRANSEYPGDWKITVERIEEIHQLIISVVNVQLTNSDVSFYATSFFEFEGDKIKQINEYWGDNGLPPRWRIDKQIGKSIK